MYIYIYMELDGCIYYIYIWMEVHYIVFTSSPSLMISCVCFRHQMGMSKVCSGKTEHVMFPSLLLAPQFFSIRVANWKKTLGARHSAPNQNTSVLHRNISSERVSLMGVLQFYSLCESTHVNQWSHQTCFNQSLVDQISFTGLIEYRTKHVSRNL